MIKHILYGGIAALMTTNAMAGFVEDTPAPVAEETTSETTDGRIFDYIIEQALRDTAKLYKAPPKKLDLSGYQAVHDLFKSRAYSMKFFKEKLNRLKKELKIIGNFEKVSELERVKGKGTSSEGRDASCRRRDHAEKIEGVGTPT